MFKSNKHHKSKSVGFKRPNESPLKSPKRHKSSANHEEPKFTFEEVKQIVDHLAESQTNINNLANKNGLKHLNYQSIKVGHHSEQKCRDLVEKLVKKTRTTRYLREVLADIQSNLGKRAYTEIILRSSLEDVERPRRPPSAYLLYHQARYEQLREQNALVAETSKIVSDEWKRLPESSKEEYYQRHADLLARYEEEMERLGLVDAAAPKKPHSAKRLYIEDKMAKVDPSLSKERKAKKREELAQRFDNLDTSDKDKWQRYHNELMEKYNEDRAQYQESHPHLDHREKPRGNKGGRPKLPEPPKSALKFFFEKKMPSDISPEEAESTKAKLKEKFQNLKAKKLVKFIKKAIQDKERFEAEIEKFKVEHPACSIPAKKYDIPKDHMKLYHRYVENRPVAPPPSAYLFYCSRKLIVNSDDDSPTHRMKVASQYWAGLSESEKVDLECEYENEIEQYIAAMTEWLEGQSEDRRRQVLAEDPKCSPDLWRTKLTKIRRSRKKRASQ